MTVPTDEGVWASSGSAQQRRGLAACRGLESSADLHDVRDFFGHAKITTTSRYVRSTPVRLAQALERMEAAAETLVDADDQPHLAVVR